MAVNIDEDTEFNDALRQHGIIPPKPERPPTPSPPASPDLSSTLATTKLDDDALDLLDDEAADSDEERMIDEYRRKRIAEMRSEAKKHKFGTILPISREDYTREVTEASKTLEEDEEEKEEDALKGTGVVCFLYNEEVASKRLADQLKTLAAKYPRTKFVSIVGNKCIENYPDRHLPTLFLYRNGSLRRQFVAYGKDRERATEELEVLLMATSMVDPLKARELEQTSSRPPAADEDDDSDEDARARILREANGGGQSTRSTTGTVNHRSKNIRTGKVGRQEDSDSDFDL